MHNKIQNRRMEFTMPDREDITPIVESKRSYYNSIIQHLILAVVTPHKINKTSVSNFKFKNTSLKHTDGKGIFKRILSFLQVDKGRLFRLYKIVLREI